MRESHWVLKKAINSEFLEAFMADDMPVVGNTNGDMRFNFPNLLMLHYMRLYACCLARCSPGPLPCLLWSKPSNGMVSANVSLY